MVHSLRSFPFNFFIIVIYDLYHIYLTAKETHNFYYLFNIWNHNEIYP